MFIELFFYTLSLFVYSHKRENLVTIFGLGISSARKSCVIDSSKYKYIMYTVFLFTCMLNISAIVWAMYVYLIKLFKEDM